MSDKTETETDRVRVVFRGDADIRELSAADLQVSGVEGFSKRKFFRNVPVEVNRNVADALIDGDIYGDFQEFVPDADAAEFQEPEAPTLEKANAASKKRAASTGAAAESTGTASTTTGGNGSSTS